MRMLALAVLAACSPAEERPERDWVKPPLDGDDTGRDPVDTADGDALPLDTAETGEVSSDPVEALCLRFNSGTAAQGEGAWSGSVASCDAGEISQPGIDNALSILNTYRWLAGLPEVDTDPSKNASAQECALMMHANGTLSHYPPSTWNCYTAEGAGAAGMSNIATAPSVQAIDLYFVDSGNSTTLGHRRWFLSNGLGPIGIGSTSSYSCAQVLYGSGSGSRTWTAWPPEGTVPYRAISTRAGSIDTTGWSLQSDSINLNSASIRITAGGTELPVTVTALSSNYGSTYALSIIPRGWATRAGTSYQVAVEGISAPFEYEVEVVDCDAY